MDLLGMYRLPFLQYSKTRQMLLLSVKYPYSRQMFLCCSRLWIYIYRFNLRYNIYELIFFLQITFIATGWHEALSIAQYTTPNCPIPNCFLNMKSDLLHSCQLFILTLILINNLKYLSFLIKSFLFHSLFFLFVLALFA